MVYFSSGHCFSYDEFESYFNRNGIGPGKTAAQAIAGHNKDGEDKKVRAKK